MRNQIKRIVLIQTETRKYLLRLREKENLKLKHMFFPLMSRAFMLYEKSSQESVYLASSVLRDFSELNHLAEKLVRYDQTVKFIKRKLVAIRCIKHIRLVSINLLLEELEFIVRSLPNKAKKLKSEKHKKQKEHRRKELLEIIKNNRYKYRLSFIIT
jgi:hypothetical protein